MKKIRNHLGRNLKSKRTKDKLSPKKRSLLMSKVRSKKTGLELEFFKTLRKHGIHFQAHPKNIIGHPDLVIKHEKVCVFIDSDFWHGWQYTRWSHKLKNKFWRDKIERNRNRDRRVNRLLRRRGWVVVRLWEHSILEDTPKQLSRF